MSIKKFNNQYKFISKNDSGYSTAEEADLYCLLKETVLASQPGNIIAEVQDLPQTLHNLHQVILKCDPKSGPFIQSMELVEKIILALKNEPNVIQMVPILPVLTDILLRSPSRIEHILKLIEDVSFDVVIKIRQPYLERLVKFCVDTLSDETVVHETNLRKVALSILINLCSNNAISLIILEQQMNLVDLQKMIPLSTYGILTCKMNLLLNECGHILRDSDVRNFLKFATKELHRIPSLDDKSLKHLIEFIRDISKRVNTKHVLKDYDFCSGIQAAMMTLENKTDDNIAVQTNALFEIIKIVMDAKNALLKNLCISIIDFANKRLKSPDTRAQAIETLATVFNNDVKVTPKNFDLDDMKATLSAILFGSDRHQSVLGPLFKLLTILAKTFKVNILNNQIVDTIFAPLVKLDSSKYFKLPIGDATMYLECLVTLSTLLELGIGDIRVNLFQKDNIQFLVAMSIKHGTTEQCCLALSLMNRFPKEEISVIISDKNNVSKVFEAEVEVKHTRSYGLEKELGVERVKNVFDAIEKACLDNKIDHVPTTDFIELYSNEMADLNQRIKVLTKNYEEISHEFDLLMGQKLQVQATSVKWSELAQNLQRSNETLLAENDRLNVIVTSLRYKLKLSLEEKEESLRRLGQEKNEASKKTKEMEEKVHTLEDELKDIEDLRQTVLSLMSKRKKPSAKET